MNLKRSADNLSRRLDRLDPVFHSSNSIGLSHWKGKPIISLDDWIAIKDMLSALDYFPDDFDQVLTYISKDEKEGKHKREEVKKWDSDYQELMEYIKNPNYGRLKCFHCLLSPDGDDPIFTGINRLVAKGLNNGVQERDGIEYPCKVVNRFQCPYERTINKEDAIISTNSQFDLDDLFRLQKMAFIVEIALAKARKDDSEIQLKDKQDLLHALTDKDTFVKILQQADEILKSTEHFRESTADQDADYIADYFMRIRDKIALEELRFY